MFCDFHTHRPASRPDVTALVSIPYCAPPVAGLNSLELHPWFLPGDFIGLPPGFPARLKECAALGEVGLDRLRGPDLKVQQQWLEAALAQAALLARPVVLHLVRCEGEFESVRKNFPGLRFLVHGFRGSPARLERFRKAGCWIALERRSLLNRQLVAALRRDDFYRLGFESDDGDLGIADIMSEAGRILNREDLEEVTSRNFQEFTAQNDNYL